MLLCTLRYLIQCRSKFYTYWLVILVSNYTYVGIYYKIMSLLHNIVPVQRTMYLILYYVYQRTFQLLINFARHCCEVPCTPFCAQCAEMISFKIQKKLRTMKIDSIRFDSLFYFVFQLCHFTFYSLLITHCQSFITVNTIKFIIVNTIK